MSEAYVELVHRALEAVIRADYREASDCFRPDAEWHNTRHFPGPLTCVGPRAIIDFWTTLVESFAVRDPVSPAGRGGTNIEQIAAGDECVVVGLHSVAWGKGSGTPLDLHWAAIFSVTAGKISRVDVHGDWKKALRVAGVEEPPMSQQNVEVVRQLYEAWARDEFPGPIELLDPDIEYVNPDGAIEPGIRRGLPEFTAAVERLFEAWDSWKMEPEEFRAVGDRVAVVLRYRATARGSGVALDGRESALLTVRSGRVVRYEWFHRPDEALKAVGLAE